MDQPLSLRAYPRAIVHVDADSFFASVEQAVNPKLRGKPVVTGKERGIASAVSIEAKQLGVKRGMNIREIRQVCPGIIHVPSDYETYSLYSKRLFEIVRRYTPVVEEYSIDECFAEITGLRRPLKLSYEGICEAIKRDLEHELDIGMSLGLAPTKVVAKIASKWNKPSGLVTIPGRQLHQFLDKIPVVDVWGIGGMTERHLNSLGIRTALQFARQNEWWIKRHVTKPHQEIWHELNGRSVLPLETEERHDYKSISKTKTFTPATADRDYVLAQLAKNTENACIKARRHGLRARRFYFLLRTEDYRHCGYEMRLSNPTNAPNVLMSLIREHLDRIYRPDTRYRLTGVVLSQLQEEAYGQADLFGETISIDRMEKVLGVADQIDKKYGKHTVYFGTSHQAIKGKQYTGERAEKSRRATQTFKGEGDRKHLGLPMLGDVD
ncbi:MAG: DNA polymerase IV [Gammaproteobacteria bacterium]|nr:DNA polymerase IV [Gammaproteobacteria bacterium]